jgi:hypothetical protein
MPIKRTPAKRSLQSAAVFVNVGRDYREESSQGKINMSLKFKLGD